MTIEPATEWSLETRAGGATLFFPGKDLRFGTEGVFERMPRTRVREIRSAAAEGGTIVEVAIGCDCRISASFVGARYLALDVADRDAPDRGIAPGQTPGDAGAARAAADDPADDPTARDAREIAAVSAAEQLLIRQIERAARQGLIELSDPAGPAPRTAAVDAAEPPEIPAPEAPALPETSRPPAMPVRPEPAQQRDPLAALLDHEQIEATTVFDRDSRSAARMAEPAVPAECLEDAALDIGGWSNGLSMHAQLPQLSRGLIGEFDAANPAALRDLARLHVRFGFGVEAVALLQSFAADFPERALLRDLAHVVDGRTAPAGGPLAVTAVCPGRHGLWSALGGLAPVYHAQAHFKTVQAAFADLPADLRALLGPALIGRLLDAELPDAARLIFDTAVRPGREPSDDLRLAEARLTAVEGDPVVAARAMTSLIERNAPNAVDALADVVRLALDGELALPDRLITDLRAAALELRGDPREVTLRLLLVEALARSAELAAALDALDAAKTDLPAAGPAFAALGVRILAEAEPARVGAAEYAEIVLTRHDLLGPAAENDPARRTIAARLIGLGLPSAALDLLEPLRGRADPAARLLAAEAHLRLDDAEAARADLADLAGPEAADLRARAFAKSGDYAEAVAALPRADPGDSVAATDAGADYLWPSGDWAGIRDQDGDPARVAMAGFMAARAGAAPPPQPAEIAASPEGLTAEAAFQAPLPRLDVATLGAARSLLANGKQVSGFVEDLLAAE